MTHLDLFSGIGGFAYAADQVWADVQHIFCDNEPFAREVLKKHWPESYIFDDIRQITANPFGDERKPRTTEIAHRHTAKRDEATEKPRRYEGVGLLTGGFPCQPFSAAGLRRGTADERHLWPEMLRVIRLTQPEWVIAENVRGLVTWNDGLVLEQVCVDLEASGYDVQPFIIPALAVNAPHRRDRIWFVAHANRSGLQEARSEQPTAGLGREDSHAPDTNQQRSLEGQPSVHATERNDAQSRPTERFSWNDDWLEVAAELCGVDDGLPVELGEYKLSKAQHRAGQLKAYGNAIVPAVAVEIMKGMK